MTAYLSSSDPWQDQPHDVVVCNFGGPTREDQVEPFLRKLFEDPFIIRQKMPDFLRRFLARRIAKKRAPQVIKDYKHIGFSPINRMTEIQAARLETLLRKKRPNTKVHIVNRYTAPFASDVVPKLDVERARLFVITLYPHLCHSTTVSSVRDFDLAFEAHWQRRNKASIRIFSWWQNPRFLDYGFGKLVQGLEAALGHGPPSEPVTVMFSAHGVPARYDERGDPYVNETRGHFEALKRRSELWLQSHEGGKHAARVRWELSFQSRVGPVEWVRPYTDELITALGKTRGGALLMVPISFTSDHIETLYEMDVTYRTQALAQGFQHYDRVVSPNEDEEFTQCLCDILVQHGF